MRKLLILLMFLVVQPVNAEVYLTYDTETKEIIDLSPRKDVVVEEGWERVELKGELEDFNTEFSYHPRFYKYKNGKIILNIDKLSQQEIAKEKSEEKAEEMKAIEKQMKLEALKALKAKGKKFKHISEKDFE